MNQLIVCEFKYFIDTRYEVGTWDKILEEASINSKNSIFSQIEIPDESVLKIIGSAAKISNKSINQILEEFGEFTIPFLIKTYCGFEHPEWKTLDVLENVEYLIHKNIVRTMIANVIGVKTTRVNKDKASIYYTSHRNLCYLIKGIIKGLARHFGQKVSISEENCKLNGKQYCEIVVKYI